MRFRCSPASACAAPPCTGGRQSGRSAQMFRAAWRPRQFPAGAGPGRSPPVACGWGPDADARSQQTIAEQKRREAVGSWMRPWRYVRNHAYTHTHKRADCMKACGLPCMHESLHAACEARCRVLAVQPTLTAPSPAISPPTRPAAACQLPSCCHCSSPLHVAMHVLQVQAACRKRAGMQSLAKPRHMHEC
eukprot:359869-Chlamydomonas_euryale.AAC.32